MDLVVLGLGALVLFVAAVGVLLVVLFAAGVAYGRLYWSGEERAYSGRWLQRTWRGARGWRLLKALLRYQSPAPPPPAILSDAAPVLYACQPHGMLALSAALAVFSGDLDTPAGPRTVLVVHDWYWWVPGLRELALALGCIDRRWESIAHALAAGLSVAVLPGGVFEMGPPAVPPPPLLGLVRRAHAHGRAPLVPVVLRGEADACWVWHGEPAALRRLRAWTLTHWGVGVGALFVPRVWAWPVLAPLVGPSLDPAHCATATALQIVYDWVRAELQAGRPDDAEHIAAALREEPRRTLPPPPVRRIPRKGMPPSSHLEPIWASIRRNLGSAPDAGNDADYY